MSDRDLLLTVVRKICDDHASAPSEAWNALVDIGVDRLSIPEDDGGTGGDLSDALAVLEVLGEFGVGTAVAENAVLGGWLLAASGHALPDGLTTVAVGGLADDIDLVRTSTGWRLSAELHRVPWARAATRLALLVRTVDGPKVASVGLGAAHITPRCGLSGDARDEVQLRGHPLSSAEVRDAPPGVSAETLRQRGAATRVALASGAMQRVDALCTDYARSRQQFGRPINRFQAVQHLLVRQAEEVVGASLASDLLILHAADGLRPPEVAAAKIVVGRAAGVVAAAAHQIHGAIGMTAEHPLGRFTRRLWAWRDEYGDEFEWSSMLGRRLQAVGADRLWPAITSMSAPGG